MLKALVISAIPDGGELLLNGWSRVVSRVEAFMIADPFFSIYTDAKSSRASSVRFDIMESI